MDELRVGACVCMAWQIELMPSQPVLLLAQSHNNKCFVITTTTANSLATIRAATAAAAAAAASNRQSKPWQKSHTEHIHLVNSGN